MNLKRFKPIYWLYNLLHYRALRHNRAAYKKYAPHKPLIASISSKDFPDKASRAWLDTGDAVVMAPQKEAFGAFPAHVQQQLLTWSKNGYMILDRWLSEEECDGINSEIGRLLGERLIDFSNGRKLMFANKRSRLIKEIADCSELKKILGFILDKEVVAFQTINFLEGSQQRAHSDSIHMTTYPLGYLIAVWIALEDVGPDNGPLFYYPGSHKLPYLLNGDFNKGGTFLTLGNKDYVSYEDALEDLVKQNGFPREEFHAKKGDVLIWHANLVHGGAPINRKGLTRKSMVVHYYARDVIKYHEITERPTLLED